MSQAAFCCCFHFAHRALCAAPILARPAAEILRLVRIEIGAFERARLLPLSLAQRARCAAPIFLRAAADIVLRFGRTPLKLPFGLPRAAKAAPSGSLRFLPDPVAFLISHYSN